MITEPLTWHVLADNPADLPDADLTVMIELDPASDYSEPVFMGSWDGEVWRDVHGAALQVVAWAEPPLGTRTAGVLAGPKPHPNCVNPDCNCVMRCEAEALPRGVAPTANVDAWARARWPEYQLHDNGKDTPLMVLIRDVWNAARGVQPSQWSACPKVPGASCASPAECASGCVRARGVEPSNGGER